jgi:hypothetical protein
MFLDADRITKQPEPTLDELLQSGRRTASEGKRAEAIRYYRQILALDPHHLETLYQLAMLVRDDQPVEALALLDVAVTRAPHLQPLHTARGLTAQRAKRDLDALESFANACALAPKDVGALYNYGLQCAEMWCARQAEVIARHLLTLRPDWPAAHYLLLRALTSLHADPQELDALYAFLIRTDPLNVSLRFAHGLHQLKMGDFKAGWDAQEWRWEIEPAKSSRLICGGTRWAGGPLEGRRLLVLGEQGFGDILQFARYLPLLIKRGAKVTLQLDGNRAALKRLLSRIAGLEVLIGRDDLPDCDLYCPLASLPYAFETTIDTIPAAAYLTVETTHVEECRRRLAHMPRPWTGLCWAGSADHSHDIRRSLPLHVGGSHYAERQSREVRILTSATRVAAATGLSVHAAAFKDTEPAFFTMEALLRRTEGSLIALQVGPRAGEVGELPKDLRQRTVSMLDRDADFYDTACLVQALDQVICVDTSTAHLAGALGKRGLLIKPDAPEWRWIERQGKSVWYPGLRLVAQDDIASI